jgi:CRISPR-associated protein Cas2
MEPERCTWRNDLLRWRLRQGAETRPGSSSGRTSRIPVGWWLEAFANPLTDSERKGHPCGEKQMLILVAYDIREPQRLARIAKHCLDYGVRVQYSVFECRLEINVFEQFWEELKCLVEPDEDRLVAYRVCAACAKEVLCYGQMERPDQVVAYVY